MTQKVEYGPDDCMNKNGSSLRGYVTATYDNLVELFGEPNAYCGDKTWNGTGFDDEDINNTILMIEKEVDFPKRDAMIAKIWKKMRDNVNYLPLHHQVIVWAMSDKLDIPIVADDGVRFIYTKFQ